MKLGVAASCSVALLQKKGLVYFRKYYEEGGLSWPTVAILQEISQKVKAVIIWSSIKTVIPIPKAVVKWLKEKTSIGVAITKHDLNPVENLY